MSQLIDVTGLPDDAVRAVETLVDLLRTNDASSSVEQMKEPKDVSLKPPEELTHEEWLVRWNNYLSKLRPCNSNMDDCRESIYDRSGE